MNVLSKSFQEHYVQIRHVFLLYQFSTYGYHIRDIQKVNEIDHLSEVRDTIVTTLGLSLGISKSSIYLKARCSYTNLKKFFFTHVIVCDLLRTLLFLIRRRITAGITAHVILSFIKIKYELFLSVP